MSTKQEQGETMQSRIRSIAWVATCLLAAGAADAAKPDKSAVPPVKKDQAQIVFVRNSLVNARKPTYLYETTSGQPRFVGIIPNLRKLVLDVAPGEHVFMIGNLPLCDFMTASMLADKRYYVVVVSRWPDGASMRPVRHQGDGYLYTSQEFLDQLKNTTLAGQAPDSIIKEETRKAEASYQAKWEQWQAKTPEQKAVLTLKAEDAE
jgi:hypothetical protein